MTILFYFVYLSKQYFYNEIAPKFRQQSFISEQVDIPLQEELFAFRYEYNTNQNIEDLEAQNNKTYIMNYALLNYQNGSHTNLTRLQIVKCSHPDLQGYNCIDYSNLQNSTISFNQKQNILSQVILLVYGCYQKSSFKQDVPSNCANQSDVLNIINGSRAGLRLKFLTSQFNTTTQKEQTSFKNQFIFFRGGLLNINTVSVQSQVTTVSKGLLVQTENVFSSPISYGFQSQSFDSSSSLQQSPYCEVAIQPDEIVYSIQINYPIFPEVLALVNSTFALLMTLGFFARMVSQRFIKQNFLMLFFQNMYQDSLEQLLIQNKLLEENQVVFLEKKMKEYEVAEENVGSKSINFEEQQRSVMDKSKQNNQLNTLYSSKPLQTEDIYFQTQNDEIKEEKYDIYKSIPSHSPTQLENVIGKGLNSISQMQKNLSEISQTVLKDVSKINNRRRTLSYRDKASNKIELTIGIKEKIKQNNENSKLPELKDYNLSSSQAQQYLKTEDFYSKKLRLTTDNQIMLKAQKIFLEDKSWNTAKTDKISKQLGKQTKKAIEEQLNKNLDILELYKDIIFLKKAALILLSKEQLAALKLIGCSTFYLNNISNKEDKNSSKENKISYFEKQLDILSQESLQSKYIQKFLTKCQKSENLEDVDYRIISSILRSN
ncbi:AMP-binding enzyme family protein (macronuclear) [Tetrahymena thermophila SB210]|uniref:AMP-binding enzyme family protein n=1 Tax=Tetrahymena thermophila (strain SB210) TaxID=312017 RepID=Q236J4_TETTS|nr:AMP-binding enzyme family protein [Tetrahymena thermophila SB210]EAR92506.2 AMP-binding enzyme family protein [Tetrahymena thermophila SB210]|eukprot:XP_001012751.2 AMP-binding enzyme family protein [Tetrahymena thermophila SB210]